MGICTVFNIHFKLNCETVVQDREGKGGCNCKLRGLMLAVAVIIRGGLCH